MRQNDEIDSCYQILTGKDTDNNVPTVEKESCDTMKMMALSVINLLDLMEQTTIYCLQRLCNQLVFPRMTRDMASKNIYQALYRQQTSIYLINHMHALLLM